MRIPRRPIIPGFHPDPSICRVGGDYFLVNSSFDYAPGVPIFHSTDLAHWRQLGHVLSRPEHLPHVHERPSGGIYAPTLRHHDGRFWMITTNVSDGPGQILVTADDPRGPWSPPIRVPDAVVIDPDLAWDEEGRCWISWSGDLPPGQQGILQAELDPTTGALLSKISVIWRGTGGQFPEGPHLYHKDDYWYLLIAEGGTERGHAATLARGRHPSGPFEPCPSTPILTARSTDGPVQNTGHADLVEQPDGNWAMVFLGVRPHGSTPAWHVLGRETFAATAIWEDGWPHLGDPIEPEARPAFVERLGAELPLSWVSPDASPGRLAQRKDTGWHLRSPDGAPVFIGRRQEHLLATATTSLHPVHGAAALELRIDPFHKLAVSVRGSRAQAIATIGEHSFALGDEVETAGASRDPHRS